MIMIVDDSDVGREVIRKALEMNDYTPEEFGRTHPGGAVGKMLDQS